MSKISKEIKQELESLVKKLNYHCYRYHVLDSPEISDAEYDSLYRKLKQIEKSTGYILPDSPTQRVGAPPLEEFEKVRHSEPMLSLDNAFSNDEVREFDQRVKKLLKSDKNISYTIEPKYDGFAIELNYIDGILHKASTRGDGSIGEDVTQNIRTIKAVPLKIQGDIIPKEIDIRGEVYMYIEEFEALNREREMTGETTFANPRNAASGTVRQLDSSIVAQRKLHLSCYGVGIARGIEFKSQRQFMDWLKNALFPIPSNIKYAEKIEDVLNAIKEIELNKSNFSFETDGAVIKVDDFSIQKKLGAKTRDPRWAIAYKFPAERGITQITEIQESVGKSGTITPVANLKPLKISGVTVSRSTLHNWDEVVRKDIRVADTVEIERAGEVIPRIVKVKLDNRTGNEGKYFPHEKCPQCGSSVIREEGEVAYRCVGLNCEAQVKEKIKNYASKSAMDIEGLGEKNIEMLYDNKLITHFTDIYNLKKTDLLNLPRFAEKSANNLLLAIEKSKKTTLARFLLSLGIPFVGEFSAKLISEHFKDVKELLNAEKKDFKKIDQIGDKVSNSLNTFLKDIQNSNVLEKLTTETLELSNPDYKKISLYEPLNKLELPFLNLTFVISGTLPKTRPEVKQYIEKLGGRVSESISKKTNYLVLGENPGSKKGQAAKLGVEAISHEKLIEMGESH